MSEAVIAASSSIILTPLVPAGTPLQLTTDPDGVVDTWDPRKVSDAGLEGAVTTQDWGQYAIDCVRALTWSGKQFLDRDAVLQIRQWLAVRGSTYRYVDAEGNDWTVELVPPFLANRIFGMPRYYTCTLTLHVLAMDMLLDAAYTGA